MDEPDNRFTHWLNMTMASRNFSQADLARAVGVADTQVSRWRRGQVVPTVHSLQRIADTFGVPRAMLDRLAGYPVGALPGEAAGSSEDPALRAELGVYQALFGQLLEQQVPRSLWRVYVEGCAALAQALGASYGATLEEARREIAAAMPPDTGSMEDDDNEGDREPRRPRNVGFRP